jgi:quaternary ammonium compound-resistance protein SugE
MAWIMLVIAELFEVGWAIGLKYTEGFLVMVAVISAVTASRRWRRNGERSDAA